MVDGGYTILVADDDESIREMLHKRLARLGMTVLTANDGSEALQLLNSVHPDLILLDVNMPHLDGLGVTSVIRANPLLQHIPILLLTALDSLDDKVSGMNAGADDYIVKPFEWPELFARVEMHLRRAKRDQEVNPMTLLPGSPTIERAIDEKLAHGVPFAVCYIDVDNFKSFNDRYGFLAGNDLIRMEADNIVKVVREQGELSWLVGHIGGDDFIVVTSVEGAEPACREIIRRFDAAIPALYSPEDRERGYILSENRRGQLERFGIVSLSIAAVIYNGQPHVKRKHISHTGAELKHEAKTHQGSIFLATEIVAPE